MEKNEIEIDKEKEKEKEKERIEIEFFGFRIQRLELDMIGFVFFSVLFQGVREGESELRRCV